MSEWQTFYPNVYYDSSQPKVYYSGILKTRKEPCGCLGTQHTMSALLEGVYVGGVEGTVIPSRHQQAPGFLGALSLFLWGFPTPKGVLLSLIDIDTDPV